MNIFRREMKANLRGLLIWALALALLNFWMVSIFPNMAADGAKLEEMMEVYPESMLKLFNMDKLNFSDPLGFYGVESFFMVVLFGSIYGAMLGSGLLAKEEDEKTIEFLLARPVSRGEIIRDKTLAWIVYLVLFNLIIGVFTWLGFELFEVGEFSRETLFLLLLAPLFVHLAFAALGFFCALFFTRRKTALTISVGLVLGLYFLNAVALLAEVEALSWLTPFRYMDAAEIVAEGAINPVFALILLAFAAFAVILTWALYRRRDITI
jgi:ABC-2 type transport system permease protein